MKSGTYTTNFERRRHFIGGSDARIIMSPDEAALIRLWKEKPGDAEPEDLSDNLIVQLGVAAEAIYGALAAILWGAFKARSAAPAASRCNQASVCRTRVLAKTYADAAAIFGNELYAAGFEALPYSHFKRGAMGLMGAGLELAHSHKANSSLFRKFVLTPIKEAGRPRFRARLSVGFP